MKVNGQLEAPASLPPRKDTDMNFIGDWVSLTAGLDAVAKKTLILEGNRTPIIQSLAYDYSN
jgi:hypothetical protein